MQACEDSINSMEKLHISIDRVKFHGTTLLIQAVNPLESVFYKVKIVGVCTQVRVSS